MYKTNQDGKVTAITIVKDFFGATMAEMKELDPKERNELASAIVRANPTDQPLSFDLVEY